MSSDSGGRRGSPELVASLRKLSKGAVKASQAGGCELCGGGIQEKHSHLLHIVDRRILCVCTQCWAEGAADPDMRPTGTRVLWLEDFDLPEEVWGRLQIPIGLSFFMKSTSVEAVVALYPSPAGATESELELEAWEIITEANPILESLEPDAEALVVNRISEPHQFAIVPIEECYALVGAIKLNWEGISGGAAIEREVPAFFEGIRRRAMMGTG